MIQPVLRPDYATLFLSGPLDAEQLRRFELVLEECTAYFHYARLNFDIDSPGGELMPALMITDAMRTLTDKGVIIHTKGQHIVASAAALLLTTGSLDHRSVHPRTKLLFHFARVLPQGEAVSAARALTLADNLNAADGELLDVILSHYCPTGAEASVHSALRRRLDWATAYKSPQHRQVMSNKIVTRLDKTIGDSPDGFSVRLRTALKRRFGEDSLIPLLEAWSLGLIDQINDITPLISLRPQPPVVATLRPAP
jgi:ATP-dependent protease ClpP protease subunit